MYYSITKLLGLNLILLKQKICKSCNLLKLHGEDRNYRKREWQLHIGVMVPKDFVEKFLKANFKRGTTTLITRLWIKAAVMKPIIHEHRPFYPRHVFLLCFRVQLFGLQRNTRGPYHCTRCILPNFEPPQSNSWYRQSQ